MKSLFTDRDFPIVSEKKISNFVLAWKGNELRRGATRERFGSTVNDVDLKGCIILADNAVFFFNFFFFFLLTITSKKKTKKKVYENDKK